MVIAATLERAIELVRARHPGAVVHQVIKRDNANNLIIDEEGDK
jgi:hypothetical protein